MLLREVLTLACAIFSCTTEATQVVIESKTEGCPPKPPCKGSTNCRATLVYETIGSSVCAVRCDTKCDSRCPPLPQCPAIKEGCTTIYKYSHISADKVCPTRCELQCECPPQPTCPPPPSKDCVTINRNKIINNRECPWECLHKCCKTDVKCPKPDPNNIYCVSTYKQYKTINGKRCATGCFCVPDPDHATFKRR